MTTTISADELSKAMATMPVDEKRRFLERLNSGMIEQISAAEANEQKKTRLDSVRAARSRAFTDVAASNTMAYLDGMLRRAGLPTVETFAEQGPAMIDSVLASARRPLTAEQRMELKSRLAQLRLA
jgi:hypothetical protein